MNYSFYLDIFGVCKVAWLHLIVQSINYKFEFFRDHCFSGIYIS